MAIGKALDVEREKKMKMKKKCWLNVLIITLVLILGIPFGVFAQEAQTTDTAEEPSETVQEQSEDPTAQDLVSGSWHYTVEENRVTITGYAPADGEKVKDGALTVPDEIEGMVVTALGKNAFKDNTDIKSITLGKGIATIDPTAFDGCANLEKINVNEDNAVYADDQGQLIDKASGETILCPEKWQSEEKPSTTVESPTPSALEPEVTVEATPTPTTDTALGQATQDEKPEDDTGLTTSAAVLNATEVTLYAMNYETTDHIGAIPAQYPQQFQIKINGKNSTIKWYAENETTRNADVSESGLMTPRKNEDYYYASGGVTHHIKRYAFSEKTTLYGYYNNQRLTLTVELKDYAETYVHKMISDYMLQNIKPSMTNYQKVDAICKFVAGYDYDGRYSTMESMIIMGGGSCWASSETVNYMCGLLGIPANYRDGRNDPGAGGEHRNSYVVFDGKLYIVEAGFVGEAPRGYYIAEEKTELRAEVNAVINQINALPAENKLTLSNESAVMAAKSAYDKLTATKKALVPAATVNKLNQAVNKIYKLQQGGTELKSLTLNRTSVTTCVGQTIGI